VHPLYEAALEVAKRRREARIRIAQLASQLGRIAYELRVTQAKVERALIKRYPNEKALGPTADSRARIYTVAVDADEGYKALRQRHEEAEIALGEARAEEGLLEDQLRVMLAAMRGSGDDGQAQTSAPNGGTSWM
jgi:hypothetical protein